MYFRYTYYLKATKIGKFLVLPLYDTYTLTFFLDTYNASYEPSISKAY